MRRVAGWDAWNVTEDADLGLRFARLGYAVGVIAATTYEDAPTDIASWLGQRSRWMKGWMQTLAVFLRTPRRHIRKIGWVQSLTALSAMSSLVAGPLFGPFYSVRFAHDLIYGDLLAPKSAMRLAFAALSLSVALFGLAALIAPMILGMKRRSLKASPLLLLGPLYLLLLSAAAWRALWEWTSRPFVWTKTEHRPRPPHAVAKKFFCQGGDQGAGHVHAVMRFPQDCCAIRGNAMVRKSHEQRARFRANGIGIPLEPPGIRATQSQSLTPLPTAGPISTNFRACKCATRPFLIRETRPRPS